MTLAHTDRTMEAAMRKHELPRAHYVLRTADIRAMVKDGSIEQQHFLIRLLAENLSRDEPEGGKS